MLFGVAGVFAIGLSATQINIFINTNFAASCAEGSVSWLNYSFRLVQLPIGLFGVAISIAALPLLARQASKKQFEDMRDTFVSSLTMVFALTIPATLGLILLADPIIQVIFEHGAFTAFDTRATAVALSLYGVGLFAYAANKVIVPVYYAIDAPRFPVIASFMAIGFNILIIVNTIEQYQHRAIALSTSTVMIINFLFLATVLYVRLGGFPLARLFNGVTKIAVATVVMSIVLRQLHGYLAEWFARGLVHQCTALFTIIVISAGCYALVLHVLKLRELTDVTMKIKERFHRS